MENISYNINKIIYDYNKNGKFLDVNFLINLTEQLINYYKLDNYIKTVKMDSVEDATFIHAGYNQENRRIEIYVKSFDYLLNNNVLPYLKYVSNKEKYINNFALTTIAHELEHALQYKNKDMNTKESFLINKTMEYVIKVFEKDGYDKYINFIYNNRNGLVHERLADIKSKKKVNEILKLEKYVFSDIICYNDIVISDRKLTGYMNYANDYYGPVIDFLKKYDVLKSNEKNKIHTYFKKICNKHSFSESLKIIDKDNNDEDKFLLGLHTFNDEYKDEFNKRKVLLKEFNNKL